MNLSKIEPLSLITKKQINKIKPLTKKQQILRDIKNVMIPLAQLFFAINFVFIFAVAVSLSVTILIIICEWVVNCIAYEQVIDFYPMLHDTFWELRHF